MAPERIANLVVLELGQGRNAVRHRATCETEFLVKWYNMEEAPEGYSAVAGGVVYVPGDVHSRAERIELQCTPRSCKYKESGVEMLVLLLPADHTLVWRQMPTGAKQFRRRLAIYWLNQREGALEVDWSLQATDRSPQDLAEHINGFIEDELGEIPTFSLDDYEHYDVALSYASEDREHALEVAKRLRTAGKHVFFDHEERAKMLGRDLARDLGAIYAARSTLCVVLVSSSYANKRWTLEELKAALSGAARAGRRDYVLPLQLDATTLEGLPPDVVYWPISQGVERFCELVVSKLARR